MDFRSYINRVKFLSEGYNNTSESINQVNKINSLILEKMSREEMHAKYYSGISPEDFNSILDADPTKKNDGSPGKYTKWLLNIFTKGKLKIEDLTKANNYLSYFNKYYNHIEMKDLNKIPDLPSLFKVVEKFIQAEDEGSDEFMSNSEIERRAKKEAEKVYQDEQFTIIVPESKEAAQYYGKGTQWCTSALENNKFDSYNQSGKLYIIIDKTTNDKYQFHLEDEQYMDATDSELEKPLAVTIDATKGLVKFFKDKGLDMLEDDLLGNYNYIYNDYKDSTTIYLYGTELISIPIKIKNKHEYEYSSYMDSDFFLVSDKHDQKHLLVLNDEKEECRDYELHFTPKSVQWVDKNWIFCDDDYLLNLYDNSSLKDVLGFETDIDDNYDFIALCYNNEGFYLLSYDGEDFYNNFPEGLKGEDIYNITYDQDSRMVVLDLDDYDIHMSVDDDSHYEKVEK